MSTIAYVGSARPLALPPSPLPPRRPPLACAVAVAVMTEPLGSVAVVVPCSVSEPLRPDACKEDSSAALRLDWRADADAEAAALPVGLAVAAVAVTEALAEEAEAALAALAALAEEAEAAELDDALAAAME